MGVLTLAVISFAVAAILGGIMLFYYVLPNKSVPKKLAMTHGIFAAVGVVLLISYGIFYTPRPILSIVLFILVALGGITLAYREMSHKPLPKWLAVGHGVGAVIAFVLLLTFILV